MVRPVREILGENVVPLRISEPPKTNSGQAANGSTLTQVKLLLMMIFHMLQGFVLGVRTVGTVIVVS